MMIIRVALAAALALGLLAGTLAAEAQQAAKVVRIGLLDYAGSDPASAARWKAFRERSRELGYVEGQNEAVGAPQAVDPASLSSRHRAKS
jgi:ABC-type sugar transport system substrate-binding protein